LDTLIFIGKAQGTANPCWLVGLDPGASSIAQCPELRPVQDGGGVPE